MVSQEEALVGRIDHNGVCRQPFRIKVIEHSPDIVVDALNATQIIFDEELISPFAHGVSLQIVRPVSLHVAIVHVFANLHSYSGDTARPPGVMIVKIVRFRYGVMSKQIFVLWRGPKDGGALCGGT